MSNPVLKFTEVSVGGKSRWRLSSVRPSEWSVKAENGADAIGSVFDVGCHVFVAINSDTGEIRDRQCTLPTPTT